MNPDKSLMDDVIKPLDELKRQGKILHQGYYVILVDGLCDAEFYRSEGTESLSSFLMRHIPKLPNWIKLICSVKTAMSDVVKSFPFQRMR